MADYNIVITSAKEFNYAIGTAFQASERQIRETRDKMNSLQAEFEDNISKGLNLMRESTLKISLENADLRKEVVSKESLYVELSVENKELKSRDDLVNSFVESWMAKRKVIDLNNNESFAGHSAEHALETQLDKLENQNKELRQNNETLLSEKESQIEIIKNTETQRYEYNNEHERFVQIELENNKLRLIETKLMEANSKLKGQMQAIKQNVAESNNVDKQKILKPAEKQLFHQGLDKQKPKKESHSRRTQRILKSKLVAMNEQLTDTEKCLEKYSNAFSENQTMNERTKKLQDENCSLNLEIDLLKAKLEEMESLVAKSTCKISKLFSKCSLVEKENVELKAQFDAKSTELTYLQSRRINDETPDTEDSCDLKEELKKRKKEKSFIVAEIKKIQIQFLKLLKSGSWVKGYCNSIQISATLPEVTEIVNALDNLV